MKTIEELLRNLARPEVLEFALASDRLPCVKVGGSFQPVDGAAPTTDAILQMLVGVGGSRYVESLSSKPTQWTTRLDGIGVITISAIMRNDVVQARFTLTKREVPHVQPRPVPPTVSKDTVTVTPTARQDVPTPKRDPRREGSEPPKAPPPKPPPHGDDDDEPTLMNQPASGPPPPRRVDRVEVPLEIELDEPVRAAAAQPQPQPQAGPPRPPPPTPLEDDDTTAEIELAPGNPVQSANAPSTAKAPPPSFLAKDTIRNIDTQRIVQEAQARKAAEAKPASQPHQQVAPKTRSFGADEKPLPSAEVARPPPAGAPPPPSTPALTASPPTPQAAPPPPPNPPPSAPQTASAALAASAPSPAAKEEPSIPSVSISIAEQALIGSVPSAQPSTGMGLDELLGLARAAGASDLHVVAGRPALLRLAGELVPRTTPVETAVVERIAREIVPKRALALLEMDGACDFSLDHATHGRFRANVSRQRTGFKVCLRLVAREIPTLTALGLPDSIAQATHHHQGLILVTGPAGHGKTSTLAALVDLVNRETTHHVITIEDPIEFVHPRKKAMMSQREVGTHTRTFGAALKAALREDPDVVVVGELRDTETMRLALAASETGHLVLGTMSTPSAARTIDRVIDLFPPAEQQQIRMTLAGALRLIVSQRLVPTADRSRLVAAAEILPSSISLFSLIRDNKTFQIPSLMQRGRAHGIVRLDDSLAELVRAGRVDVASARAFAEAPEDFESLIAQRPAPQQPAPATAMQGTVPKKRAPEEQAMDLGGLLSKAGSLFGKKG